MDLKQSLQLRGGVTGGKNFSKIASDISDTTKSSANSAQSDGGNNSSCSNNHSTSITTGESDRGSSPVTSSQLASFVGGGRTRLPNDNCSSYNTSCNPPVSQLPVRPGLGSELDAHDPRMLKLARWQKGHSARSCNSETQTLFSPIGGFNSGANHANVSRQNLASYISNGNHSGENRSPTSNCAGMPTACSLLNSGFQSKTYPYATLQEEPIRRDSSQILSALSASQPSILSSAAGRAQNRSLSSLNTEPSASFFTQEQLLEFTHQTFIFKHFVAGVAPPPSLLLPIINSIAKMSRLGAGHLIFGGNAGLLGVGGLRGNIDPEPGRCRRTDGKKWRCAREVVSDQKYCEKHMHRGRHRARVNKLVNGSSDNLNTFNKPTASCAVHPSGAQACIEMPTVTSSPSVLLAPNEPHLQFSLQPASMSSIQMNRSSVSSNDSNRRPLGADVGVKRMLDTDNICGPPSKALAVALPDHSPNLAKLLRAHSVDKATTVSNLHFPDGARDTIEYPFSFASQHTNRQTDNSSLGLLVDSDPWCRIERVPDNVPSNLPGFEQFSEEQNKRSSYNTELSIATLKSPLTNLPTKFGSGQPDDLVGSLDASHFMGLSMDTAGAKGSGTTKSEEDRYSGRNTWVPIAWDSPLIGGPLGEVLQPNAAANSGGSFGWSLAKNGGERCLNLIEDESWVHQEPALNDNSVKDGHSPSLASPTGVLQVKASFTSYSDSSSSASSPRSALKLDSSVNLGI